MTTDNKIFIGNLPHYISEQYLRQRFEEHGNIRDLYYCKDILGSDRGWATITYMTSDEAATAVGIEHDNEDPFPGSERALHVKFFNTPLTGREGTVFDLRPKSQRVLTPWEECKSDNDGSVFYVNKLTDETQWERPPELDQFVQNPAGANVIVNGEGLLDHESTGLLQGGAVPVAIGSSESGPPGCNLFIHGNLAKVTDAMVYDAFSMYGELLACKVHVPSALGGFGYVSYTTPDAATAAVRGLNLSDCFSTGQNLKIMLKKGEETFNAEAQKIVEEGMIEGFVVQDQHAERDLDLGPTKRKDRERERLAKEAEMEQIERDIRRRERERSRSRERDRR